MKLLLLIGSVLILSACNVELGEKKEEQKKDTSIKYKYEVNGCSTGEVSASSQEDLCNKLKDDALNKYCASSVRYERFKQECPGQSWNK